MQTTKRPYELLVRWNQNGKLQGAQIQYRYIIEDNEKIIAESLSDVEWLSIDGDFPLADVMDSAQAAALESVSEYAAKMQLQQQVIDAYEVEISRLKLEVNTLKQSGDAK